MKHSTDFDLPERPGRIDASRLVLNEKIRAMEARVMGSFRAIINAGALPEDVEMLRELESNLEWFLIWRLKLADTGSSWTSPDFTDISGRILQVNHVSEASKAIAESLKLK